MIAINYQLNKYACKDMLPVSDTYDLSLHLVVES